MSHIHNNTLTIPFKSSVFKIQIQLELVSATHWGDKKTVSQLARNCSALHLEKLEEIFQDCLGPVFSSGTFF